MTNSKQPVQTGLFSSPAPLEWAVVNTAPKTLYTAHIPIDAHGQVVEGGIEPQIRQTMENIQQTLKAAGENMDSVLQVLIYVTKRSDLAIVNAVYAEYFTSPFPNRAAVIVPGFARENMLVELVVTAAVHS